MTEHHAASPRCRPDAAPLRGEAEWEAMLAAEGERDRHGVVRLRRRLLLAVIAHDPALAARVAAHAA